jgi:hypothetical protein
LLMIPPPPPSIAAAADLLPPIVAAFSGTATLRLGFIERELEGAVEGREEAFVEESEGEGTVEMERREVGWETERRVELGAEEDCCC